MLTESFRRINKKQNEHWFRTGGDTFRSYLSNIDQSLPASGTILDLGAGAVTLASYLPRVGEKNILLVAVDYSRNGLLRNKSQSRVLTNAVRLPFQNESFNVIAASCVFEHVEHPISVIQECFRVLKKGGKLVFYTPHRRSYIAALARLTPLGFHRWIRILQTGQPRHEVEAIKTFYKMNTPIDIQQCKGDFKLSSLEITTGAPSYTMFCPPPIHLAFIFLHKILQRVTWLRKTFGETITGCLLKS